MVLNMYFPWLKKNFDLKCYNVIQTLHLAGYVLVILVSCSEDNYFVHFGNMKLNVDSVWHTDDM